MDACQATRGSLRQYPGGSIWPCLYMLHNAAVFHCFPYTNRCTLLPVNSYSSITISQKGRLERAVQAAGCHHLSVRCVVSILV